MAEKIQVTTELLLEKKETWSEMLEKILGMESHAEEVIKSLEEGLKADFMQLLIKNLLSREEERKELFLTIKSHVDTLAEIAGNYSKAERSNTLEYGEH